MNNLSKKIWQKIQQEHIKPINKKIFYLKRGVLWLIGILSLILGALTTAIIIFMIKNIDFDIAHRFSQSKAGFTFLALPYFWLLLLIIFSLAVYYNYRHTKYGYRLKLGFIILIFILSNLILGLGAYALDWGHKLEDTISKNFPFYQKIDTQNYLWHATEKGLLAGTIISFQENNLTISDYQNKTWQLILKDNNLATGLKSGEKIKIIGEQTGESEFLVEEIRPWCGCNKCLNNNSFCNLH